MTTPLVGSENMSDEKTQKKRPLQDLAIERT